MCRVEPEQPELDAADFHVGETLTIWRRRYREARAAGLDQADAARFAEQDCDIGQLRKLSADGCAPQLIAEIML